LERAGFSHRLHFVIDDPETTMLGFSALAEFAIGEDTTAVAIAMMEWITRARRRARR
jgi:hypothetical protein